VNSTYIIMDVEDAVL